jgi:hypothetical protein
MNASASGLLPVGLNHPWGLLPGAAGVESVSGHSLDAHRELQSRIVRMYRQPAVMPSGTKRQGFTTRRGELVRVAPAKRGVGDYPRHAGANLTPAGPCAVRTSRGEVAQVCGSLARSGRAFLLIARSGRHEKSTSRALSRSETCDGGLTATACAPWRLHGCGSDLSKIANTRGAAWRDHDSGTLNTLRDQAGAGPAAPHLQPFAAGAVAIDSSGTFINAQLEHSMDGHTSCGSLAVVTDATGGPAPTHPPRASIGVPGHATRTRLGSFQTPSSGSFPSPRRAGRCGGLSREERPMILITAKRGSFKHRFRVTPDEVEETIRDAIAIGMTDIEVWS